ncbi:vWA domain-containing protein [Actinokineospora sp. NBRC 105648]|uniref:vWA domain-containing protein n=1 Tax=Actinokineospora sp. NBRC 105648 TaxID=3032206 RepID=UPI0024A0BC63|nr:vWA domain-containing protein [Actinokineospora sp. NBRC 105648]GLZ42325.1 hypothetical protein Acsp05_59490 [Actinokineospora sp. NBRC 105648]
MSSWTRENFEAIGLTQSPPGPHLPALQARHAGDVLLCIDVSGSMSGRPLEQAVKGGVRFLEEARTAHYRCGLVLWGSKVNVHVPIGTPHDTLVKRLRSATIRGGTDIVPALKLAITEFADRTNDKVLCIFSDGGLTNRGQAIRLSQELCAMGVRIVVRGLGTEVAATLTRLQCPGTEQDRTTIPDVESLDKGIAAMANSLTTTRKDRR